MWVPAVQLNAAHVLVANPDVHVGEVRIRSPWCWPRSGTAPPSLRSAFEVPEQGITLRISIVALKSSAVNVSYSDTTNQTRNSGGPLPTPSKTCSQSASAGRWVSELLASASLATDTRAYP